MRRKFLLSSFLVLAIFLSGCSLKKSPAALQINSIPTASVFIDGKHVGNTPFVNREMKAGEVTIKLIPESTTSALASWEGKLKLVGGVLSVVSREFAEQDEFSSGDILTLEPIRDKKNASLAVVTSPDGAMVQLDGENRGFSPLVLDKINEGEHQLDLSLSGYRPRSLKAKAVNGFKLVVNSKLAREGEESLTPTPTSVPGSEPTPKVTTKPTVSPSAASPTPRPTLAIGEGVSYVKILDTPTGWLRVRSEASTSSTELAKVYPGEKYPLLEESSGWYKIRYAEGKEGWISGQYAEKYE